MDISKQLLKSLLEKMVIEWHLLWEEVSLNKAPEVEEIKKEIEEKMSFFKDYQVSLNSDTSWSSDQLDDIREKLRTCKLDLRFSQRRWKRLIVSKNRNERRLSRLRED